MLEFFLFLISGVGYGFYFDLNMIEAGLVILLLVAAAKGWLPTVTIPRSWIRLAHRRTLAVAVIFGLALAVRTLLIPAFPAPSPQVPDEFSHLLIADTLTQ